MFFFFFDDNINEKLNEKLSAFADSLESNGLEFVKEKNRIDVVCNNYGICSLKAFYINENEISIKIFKSLNTQYSSIQKKSQFDRYWKENIPQKQFTIDLSNNGDLKKLLDLIIGLKDTFISDITVDFKINEIEFKDYKGFSDEKFKFNKQLTLLIGKNGCGKTSILDGVAVGIGAFLNGIDEDTDSKNIYKEDIRFKIDDFDDMLQRNSFPPTKISFKSRFINQDVEWSRTKVSLESSRTSTKDSSIITTPIKQIVDDIRNRNKDIDRKVILPVFSYHGVGRVANFTKDMKTLEKTENISRFFGYKDCLKVASNYKVFVNWYRKMKYREFELSRRIPSLEAVENAIAKTLSILTKDEEYKVIGITYFEKEISVKFDNSEIVPISYLSDGYKDIIGIVSDIAYRMAILNSSLGSEILNKTPGIVLIDEIEVHLHPKWQQNILRALKEIFPKVQFIVTTHSPMVVSTTEENEAIELIKNKDKVIPSNVGNPQEWYMSDILRNVFGVKERANKDKFENHAITIEDKLKQYSELIKKYTVNKDINLKNNIECLYKEIIPSIPEGSPRRRVVERLKGLIE